MCGICGWIELDTRRDTRPVRPNVAAGKRPEVFPIDLEAILLKHDRRSDLTLEPGDQVYVGETLRSSWGRCLPPWLRLNP